MNHKSTYFLGLFVLALSIVSCGVKRNNPIAKGYHNMTSLFNGYYNGEQKFKEGVHQINQEFRVPAEGYIPVVYVGTEKESQSVGPVFEEAIQKAEVVLFKHDHKKNHWKDNCRFLIGRSWFYKKNYILALQQFTYIEKTFPDSKLMPEVYIWMVRTHFRDQNLSEARKILKEKLEKMDLSKRQKGELAMVRAEIFLAEGDLDEVIRTLESNKKFIKGKRNRARVHFLLGQIYAEKEQFSKSFEHYRKVTRINTDYELIFNANLRIVRLYVDFQEGQDDTKKINRLLKKMLRDEKNIEFRDRIYYEYALLDLKRQDQPAAIEHLKQSIRYNTSNQRQKALSYYKIGQIYFYEIKDFKNAQAYFDSASVAITKDAPEYLEISTISKTLKEYVGYVNTIEFQDSMVRLSRMTDAQLQAHCEEIIEERKRKEAEEAERLLEELNQLDDPNLFAPLEGNGNRGGNRGSGFYFDNQALVSSGKQEFAMQWGSRRNEDNWRRSQKDLVAAADGPQDSVTVNPEDVEKFGKEVAELIANVPRTPEQVEQAHLKIADALYGLGQVYQSKLKLLDSADAVYNRLIRRYPENVNTPKALYALFKMYEELDPGLAYDYRDKLCGKHPKSRFCRLAKGELVESEDAEAQEQEKSFYTGLYNAFDNKDYASCISFAQMIIDRKTDNPLLPKVYMIQALSYGHLDKKDDMRQRLEYIKKNYPESEVTPDAIRILSMMGGSTGPGDSGPGVGGPGSDGPRDNPRDGGDDEEVRPEAERHKGFQKAPQAGEKVYVVIFIDKNNTSKAAFDQVVREFNSKYYSTAGLNTSIFLYNQTHFLAYVSQFDDYRAGKQYTDLAGEEESIRGVLKTENDRLLMITPTNFREAFQKKRFPDYISFFDEVILKSL